MNLSLFIFTAVEYSSVVTEGVCGEVLGILLLDFLLAICCIVKNLAGLYSWFLGASKPWNFLNDRSVFVVHGGPLHNFKAGLAMSQDQPYD